MGEKPLWMGNR